MADFIRPDGWYIQLRYTLGLGRSPRWSNWTLPRVLGKTAYYDPEWARGYVKCLEEWFVPQGSRLEFRVVQGSDLIKRRPYLAEKRNSAAPDKGGAR